MSQRVNSVEVKVREKSSAAGSQAFQAEVVPNAVYEDEEFGGDGKSESEGTATENACGLGFRLKLSNQKVVCGGRKCV